MTFCFSPSRVSPHFQLSCYLTVSLWSRQSRAKKCHIRLCQRTCLWKRKHRTGAWVCHWTRAGRNNLDLALECEDGIGWRTELGIGVVEGSPGMLGCSSSIFRTCPEAHKGCAPKPLLSEILFAAFMLWFVGKISPNASLAIWFLRLIHKRKRFFGYWPYWGSFVGNLHPISHGHHQRAILSVWSNHLIEHNSPNSTEVWKLALDFQGLYYSNISYRP